MSANGDVRVGGPVKRVMVGTDRSQTAERAVAWAAAFADRYGADLHIVQVILPGSPTDTEFGAAEATRARGAADELQTYATQIAGERGRAHVVINDDPAMAIVSATEEHAIDVLVVGNAGMAGRKEFLLGNVPNRISHNARCTVIIVNTADGQAAGTATAARAPASLRASAAEVETEPHLMARGTQDRDRLREARAEGALRPAGRGGRGRPGAAGQAAARRARGAGADVREARTDPLDAARSAPARVHQGAGDAPGQRAAAHRGAGRRRDGGGTGRSVGGRVRSHRAAAARRRHDRRGAPRDARERREGRGQGAASRREGADRTGPGAARGLRREGESPPRAQAGDRHGGGVHATSPSRCTASSTSARRRATCDG